MHKEVFYISLADKRKIYTEYYKCDSKLTLFIIHGGPGESCISFSYIASILAGYMNVIMVDQRGVMRSEEETCPEKLTVNQIIDDFEDIRKQLNVERWFLLGHSFGGYIAMRYAIKYCNSLMAVIYENPCFNIKNSLRQIIQKYAEYYKSSGEYEKYTLVRKLKLEESIVAQLDGTLAFPDRDRRRVFKSNAVTEKCKKYYDVELITAEALNRCYKHYNILKQDKSLNINFMKKVLELTIPSLLIQGENDPTLPESDKKQWLCNDKNFAIVVQNVGHYVHSDVPELFTAKVIDYINRR